MNVAVHPHLTDSPDAHSSKPCSVASDDRSSFNYISICTGGGGLDLGLELAIPAARPVCLVEREAFAVAHLVAAMQAGFMADAPVWSDVRTFDGRAWRGLVDGLVGGIPCQPHSMAGKRGGSTDARDLWSDTRRIIAQARPWFVLIENVAGMLTAGADEVAGAQRVRRDLRKLGYAVEGGLFTAAEVGAPHERKRLFILALRSEWIPRVRHELADSRCDDDGARAGDDSQIGQVPGENSEPKNSANVPDGCSAELADCDGERQRREGDASKRPTGLDRHGGQLGQPIGSRHDGHDWRQSGQEPADGREQLGHPKNDDGRGKYEPRSARCGRAGPAGTDQELGDSARLQRQAVQRNEPDGTGFSLFPPGPGERDRWAAIAATHPHLEPAVCRVAHGLAAGVDNTRIDELRMLGNGVVPLEAAYAIRSLLAAHHAAGTQTNHPALMEIL